MSDGQKSVWVFGYGSLIWDTGNVKPAERREGVLPGRHREWTRISSTRHGAPTCSLRPGGQVKGVFLRLEPATVDKDLEVFRVRENRQTEQTLADVPELGSVTHVWTMGSNLGRFPGFRGVRGEHLSKALADRAKSVTKIGNDGVTAQGYICRVHEFDPDDGLTTAIAKYLRPSNS